MLAFSNFHVKGFIVSMQLIQAIAIILLRIRIHIHTTYTHIQHYYDAHCMHHTVQYSCNPPPPPPPHPSIPSLPSILLGFTLANHVPYSTTHTTWYGRHICRAITRIAPRLPRVRGIIHFNFLPKAKAAVIIS